MPEIFHELCVDDERMLLESAADDLPEVAFLDGAGDELFRLAQEAKTTGPPAGAPAGWGASSNGVLAAAAMALRTGRAIGLLVRSGYGVEVAGLVRRLGEIAQHAAGCAQHPTGTYARNWGEGAGKAGKPSSAFMQGVTDPGGVRDKWCFLSRMEHANLSPYLNFMYAHDERGEMPSVQEWLGHADSKTTQIYPHYAPSEGEVEQVDAAFGSGGAEVRRPRRASSSSSVD